MEKEKEKEKYILLKFDGRLGNELFQLANAHNLSLKYGRKLIICQDNNKNMHFDTIFSGYKQYLVQATDFMELLKKSVTYRWSRFEYKEILLKDDVQYYNLVGYYQSYKYFDLNTFKSTLNISYQPVYNLSLIHI